MNCYLALVNSHAFRKSVDSTHSVTLSLLYETISIGMVEERTEILFKRQ